MSLFKDVQPSTPGRVVPPETVSGYTQVLFRRFIKMELSITYLKVTVKNSPTEHLFCLDPSRFSCHQSQRNSADTSPVDFRGARCQADGSCNAMRLAPKEELIWSHLHGWVYDAGCHLLHLTYLSCHCTSMNGLGIGGMQICIRRPVCQCTFARIS